MSHFFATSDQNNALLNLKKRLEVLKADPPNSQTKEAVVNLLGAAAHALKSTSLPTSKVAAFLLLADIYATLSLMHSTTSLANAKKALDESIKCVERAQTVVEENQAVIIDDVKSNSTQTLDFDFIKQCNTYSIGDPNQAMKIIGDNLLPHLNKLALAETLFMVDDSTPDSDESDDSTAESDDTCSTSGPIPS